MDITLIPPFQWSQPSSVSPQLGFNTSTLLSTAGREAVKEDMFVLMAVINGVDAVGGGGGGGLDAKSGCDARAGVCRRCGRVGGA